MKIRLRQLNFQEATVYPYVLTGYDHSKYLYSPAYFVLETEITDSDGYVGYVPLEVVKAEDKCEVLNG